jgi:hypothetical protein
MFRPPGLRRVWPPVPMAHAMATDLLPLRGWPAISFRVPLGYSSLAAPRLTQRDRNARNFASDPKQDVGRYCAGQHP